MNAQLILCLLASFYLGAVPTAYLVVKKVKGLDIRRHGSGNVGATNTFRVLGKKYGTFVFVVDLLKGAIPAWLVAYHFSADPNNHLYAFAAGIAAVLGHIFTPFLGFKGGKGIATGAGALLGSYPMLFVLTLVAWLLLFLTTRIVSVSSVLALGILAAASFWLLPDRTMNSIFVALFLLISWTHRTNIYRLLTGNEYKFDKKN